MKMPVNERSWQAESAQLPIPSETTLITVIAVAFLFLHVLAGILVQQAFANDAVTVQETVGPALYD
jgi:hypothetical protein